MAAAEWALLAHGDAFATDATILSPYARPSLVVAADAITLGLLGVRRAAPRWVRAVSESSLGIYCIHPFLVTHGASVFRGAWDTIAPRGWLLFLVAAAISAALAHPLRRGLVT